MFPVKKQPDLLFPVEGDIYKAQRRPGSAQLLMNQDYSGISVLDVWNQQMSSTRAFPHVFAQAQGTIDAWCLHADGNQVLLFHQEQRVAVSFSLNVGESATQLNIPVAIDNFADLRSLWQGETLLLSGGKTSRIFSLQWSQKQPVFVQKSTMQARLSHPDWVHALGLLPLYHCTVLQVHSDTGEMLYHNRANNRIGVVNWKIPSHWSVPAPKEVPGLASRAGHLFVLHEYEIHALNTQGAVQTIYPVANGFHYSCIETLPPDQEHPAALVAIASKLSNEHQNLVHVSFLTV